jgi:hypothetical protein
MAFNTKDTGARAFLWTDVNFDYHRRWYQPLVSTIALKQPLGAPALEIRVISVLGIPEFT